jgi:hypothetical protein
LGWKKGESGNPNGRPPKAASLTSILSTKSEERVRVKRNSPIKIERKQMLADRVWQAAIDGYVTFPDGRQECLDTNTWFALIKWLYNRVDGLPPQAIDLSGSLQTVNITSDEFAQARAELEEWQQERFGDDNDGENDDGDDDE